MRYNRRRGIPVRKFSRRSSFRKMPRWRRGRAGRRTRRPRISPWKKKSDVMRPAHATSNSPFVNIEVGGAQPNMFVLFSPTARSRSVAQQPPNDLEPNLPHARFQKSIDVTGYKDKLTMTFDSSFIWRRVVFWTHERFSQAIGPLKGDFNLPSRQYHTRQLTPLQKAPGWKNLVFEGTEGIDYDTATMHMAPLNKRAIYVQMDKTYTLNGGETSDFTIRHYKHWFPGGRIDYDDREKGNVNTVTTPWSEPSVRSKGNMYILDIFSDAGSHSSGVTVGKMFAEGRLYWKES